MIQVSVQLMDIWTVSGTDKPIAQGSSPTFFFFGCGNICIKAVQYKTGTMQKS
jgi:hypothetical protein